MARTRTLSIALVLLATTVGLGCETEETARRLDRFERRITTVERFGRAKLHLDISARTLAMIEDEVQATKETRGDTTLVANLKRWERELGAACASAKAGADIIAEDLARIESDMTTVELRLVDLEDQENAVEGYADLSVLLAAIADALISIDDEVQRVKEANGDGSLVWSSGGCDGYSAQIDAIEGTIAELTAAIATAKETIENAE